MKYKIIMLVSIFTLLIGLSIATNHTVEDTITELDATYQNDIQNIDCVQATVTLYPIKDALCDLSNKCLLTYSFSVSEIDYSSGFSKRDNGSFEDTRVYFYMNYSQINTKYHSDLVKDEKKKIELQAKESCKSYKDRLKEEYKFEVVI